MAASLAFGAYIVASLGLSVLWLIAVALLITIGMCWFLRLEYALGAIIALFHDVIITMGAFALTDREITLSIVAALLTIVGYSLNDTIVVFDRIRENFRQYRGKRSAEPRLPPLRPLLWSHACSSWEVVSSTTLPLRCSSASLSAPIPPSSWQVPYCSCGAEHRGKQAVPRARRGERKGN